MFIELTDHLRCPEEHDEAYLVLLPDAMSGRSVVTGHLGCPVCGRTFRVERGELDLGGAPPAVTAPDAGAGAGAGADTLDPAAIVALSGMDGPGGYFVLVGGPARVWRAVGELLPGVAIVAVNPPADVGGEQGVSVLRGGRIPLKTSSVRGVVLGAGFGGDSHWVREAARVTLPGLRIVGAGAEPAPETIDLMAGAGGVWVGTKRR